MPDYMSMVGCPISAGREIDRLRMDNARLTAKNARLEKKLDAVVADITHCCHTCAYIADKPCIGDPSKLYRYKSPCDAWQWRGEAGEGGE